MDIIWPHLWSKLGRDTNAPELGPALAALAAVGLVSGPGESERYDLHPGVAEAGRTEAGKAFRAMVDAECAGFLHVVVWQASGNGPDGSMNTDLMVHAALAAVPYLLRKGDWDLANALLESVFVRDQSRKTATAVLPALQQVARHYPGSAVVLARVLKAIDSTAAEDHLRAALDAAVADDDYRAATAACDGLTDLFLASGRLAEALALTDHRADYTRRAGLGPWTQLYAAVRHLQVLGAMGQARQVLAEVSSLRHHMSTLPAIEGRNENVTASGVREGLLDVGRSAALQLGQWDQALDFGTAITDSMRGRHALDSEIIRARFTDYGPLLRLGRTDEVMELLLDCRQAFEDAGLVDMLGKTIAALADVEDGRGHGEAAIRLQRDALRYAYLAGEIEDAEIGYHNLGNYLRRHARKPALALASHLAAALVRALTGLGGDIDPVRAAAIDLREVVGSAASPASVADLDRRLGDVTGTDLPGLVSRLSPDLEMAEQALRDLIAQVQALAAEG
jgi:hypothetical protein